jgi:glucan phosphoethanolaminetransferase (alkaline phosphatase superfamily)
VRGGGGEPENSEETKGRTNERVYRVTHRTGAKGAAHASNVFTFLLLSLFLSLYLSLSHSLSLSLIPSLPFLFFVFSRACLAKKRFTKTIHKSGRKGTVAKVIASNPCYPYSSHSFIICYVLKSSLKLFYILIKESDLDTMASRQD